MVKTSLNIPIDLSKEIIDFALNEDNAIQYFITNSHGSGRRYCLLNKFNIELSAKIKSFADICFSSFGVTVKEEPIFGNFIGVHSKGAFVHTHNDHPSKNNEVHVRLNFLVQKPDGGGIPLIEGKICPIDEGNSWLNFASLWFHGSTPVVGDKKRIVLSLGSFIDQSKVHELLKTYNINSYK